MNRYTPLRRMSRKREREERAYQALRAELLDERYRLGTRCPAAGFLMYHCSGRAVVHHVLPRAQGGTHAEENLMVLCAFHHRLIHDNPTAAYAAGLLRHRVGSRIR